MRSYIGYITEITPIKDGCMFTLRCYGYSVVVVAGADLAMGLKEFENYTITGCEDETGAINAESIELFNL